MSTNPVDTTDDEDRDALETYKKMKRQLDKIIETLKEHSEESKESDNIAGRLEETTTTNTIKVLEREIQELNHEIKQLKRLNNTQRRHLEDADLDIENIEKENRELHNKIKTMEKNILGLERNKDLLEENIKLLEKEKESILKKQDSALQTSTVSTQTEPTEPTEDMTRQLNEGPDISRTSDLVNTIKNIKKENEEALRILKTDIERKKKEKEILEKRIAKMQKESRERIDREERQKIEDAKIEAGEKVEPPELESLTENPVQINLLEEIKKIELGTNLISLEEELGGLYP